MAVLAERGQLPPTSIEVGILLPGSQKEGTMFSRQLNMTVRACPDCGGELAVDRDLLRCEEHGTFFVYGRQLLVRAPQARGKLPAPLLPWENQAPHRSR